MTRFGLATGVVSVLTFLGLGTMLLMGGRTGWGSVLLAIGAFRAAWLARTLAPWDEGPPDQPPPPPPAA